MSTWMCVHIAVHQHATLFGQSFDHRFCVPNRRIRLPNDSSILAIQIFAGERAARVAHYDAVRIQHRDQFEYKFVPQFLRHQRIARDEVHQSLHHPWWWSLARMHTRTHNDCTFLLQLINGRERKKKEPKRDLLQSVWIRNEKTWACILHDDTSEPLCFRLAMAAVLSPWDNKYYCRLMSGTANAICRISIWWDPFVWPSGSPVWVNSIRMKK